MIALANVDNLVVELEIAGRFVRHRGQGPDGLHHATTDRAGQGVGLVLLHLIYECTSFPHCSSPSKDLKNNRLRLSRQPLSAVSALVLRHERRIRWSPPEPVKSVVPLSPNGAAPSYGWRDSVAW